MRFNDAFDQGQAYSHPLRVSVQFVEEPQYPVLVIMVNADAVVSNIEYSFIAILSNLYVVRRYGNFAGKN